MVRAFGHANFSNSIPARGAKAGVACQSSLPSDSEDLFLFTGEIQSYMSLQLQRLSDYATPSSTRPGSRDELSKVFISACVKNRDNLVICRVVGGVCASYTGRLAIRAASKGIDFARDVNTRA